MASTIGIRVYLVSINRKRNRDKLSFDDASLNLSPSDFMSKFVADHGSPTQDDDLERSWYFEQKKNTAHSGNSTGYVHYGTFGFESNFKDRKTKKTNYRRKTTDVEEISLFYDFWFPPSCNFALLAFQSFQGRSCISLVMNRMREAFDAINPEIFIRFTKLLPSDAAGSLFLSAPVKRLRLYKKDVSSDIADRYLGRRTAPQVNLEISLTTKKKHSLGILGEVLTSFKEDAEGVVAQDGVTYDSAVADIKIGDRIRPVGVFGADSEAGIIDLTEAIKRGPDGHPTFESIYVEVKSILKEFYVNIQSADL